MFSNISMFLSAEFHCVESSGIFQCSIPNYLEMFTNYVIQGQFIYYVDHFMCLTKPSNCKEFDFRPNLDQAMICSYFGTKNRLIFCNRESKVSLSLFSVLLSSSGMTLCSSMHVSRWQIYGPGFFVHLALSPHTSTMV